MASSLKQRQELGNSLGGVQGALARARALEEAVSACGGTLAPTGERPSWPHNGKIADNVIRLGSVDSFEG
jgi:hypothetical protein